METTSRSMNALVIRMYQRMLGWYPPRFRREFAGEIHATFLDRMAETGQGGFALQELAALSWSILRERWHERRKGQEMEEQNPILGGPGGAAVLRVAGAPEKRTSWLLRWILLNFLAFPLGALLATPFAMPYFWIFKIANRVGWQPGIEPANLEVVGFFTAFALLLATAQWLLLRRVIPRPGRWFAATALGAWLAGLAASAVILTAGAELFVLFWKPLALFSAGGLVIGLGQWLALRRSARRAGWLVLINVVAMACLMIFPRDTITNTAEGLWALLTLALPGAVSGLGLWLLLRFAQPEREPVIEKIVPRTRIEAERPLLTKSLYVAVAVAAFFFLSWVYAASQLAMAKEGGVYPTVEAAIIGNHSTGWGGANVISITDIHTGPNYRDGSLPYVQFGTAVIHYDRIPDGLSRPRSSAGSFYIHTREGWVLMPEGAFPEYIGWAMMLYNLEGAREFQAGIIE